MGLQKFYNTENSDEEVSLSKFNDIQTYIATRLDAKRFMVTESGHFGLGPAMAQEGDIVARLYGSRVFQRTTSSYSGLQIRRSTTNS
jgi:hypothetical protein